MKKSFVRVFLLAVVVFCVFFGATTFVHAAPVNPVGVVTGDVAAPNALVTKSQIPDINDHNAAMKAGAAGASSLYFFGSQNATGVLTDFVCRLGPGLVGGCLGPDGQPIASGLYDNLIGYIGSVYSAKPASTQTYIADVLQDLHVNIAQPAYAQGVGLGFASLNPILDIWKVFRNFAYFGFVIIFLVIGFMIMFRQKIGGQAVVTAQQAIPKIIIALLLVTFSYAIAGLMIDAMYLIMYLLAGLFGRRDLIGGNVFSLSWNLLGSATSGGASAVGSFVAQTLGDSLIAQAANLITGLTAAIIIIIVIIFNAFRLFIALLRVYIEIILLIAFAPVTLMMEAIPGNNAFQGWFKSLFFNLMVFPTILLLLIVFNKLSDVATAGVNASSTYTGFGFLPPYISGAASAGVIPFLAGLALIMALPEAVDEVKKLGGEGGGIFGKLIQAGFKNFWDQRKRGIDVASAPFRAAGTAALAGWAANRAGANLTADARAAQTRWATLGGAAAGLVGPRRVARVGGRLISQYGEFTENYGGVADDIERGIYNIAGQVGGDRLQTPVGRGLDYLRARRRVPVEPLAGGVRGAPVQNVGQAARNATGAATGTTPPIHAPQIRSNPPDETGG